MSRRPLLSGLLVFTVFAPLLLAADEPAKVDRYGDPLPKHARARLGTMRFRDGDRIDFLAYSPDGKVLASISEDKGISLWDPNSGRRIRFLEGHGPVRTLAISPDSKLLVSASWDVATEKLYLWNLTNGKLLCQLAETNEKAFILAFTPDGNTIVSGHTKEGVRHWNTHTGLLSRAWVFDKPLNEVSASAFAPDGKTLATAGGTRMDGRYQKIQLWDVNTGKELRSEGKTKEFVWRLAFSPQGTILAVARQHAGICFLGASDLVEINRIDSDQTYSGSIHFFPDGKKLLTKDDGKPVVLWDVQSGKQLRKFPEETENDGEAMALSPDGKTVATATGTTARCGMIKRWDARTGALRPPHEGHDSIVDQVAFLADGETVASITRLSWDIRHVFVWPQGTGGKLRPFPLPEGAQTCRLCPDRSTLAFSTKDGFLVLLDLSSGGEVVRCPIPARSKVVAVSPDNRRAALIVELESITCGKDVFRYRQAVVEVWDLPGKKVLYRCEPTPSKAPAMEDSRCWAFSPNGQRMAFGTDNQVRVWDLDLRCELWRNEVPGGDVHSVAFSPDGRMLATGSKHGTLCLWELATGKKRLQLQGHQGPIHSLDFTPDGKMLASGSADTTARLWSVRDGKEFQLFMGHRGAVGSVALSPNGRRLVSGSSDTTALIWDIPMECGNRQPALGHLRRATRDRLWGKLADFDAAAAYACLQELAAAQAEAVSLCRERLFETPSTPPEQIERWIAQLDDEDYLLREQASSHLERVEGEATKALERALKSRCSLEARGRLEALLESVKGKQPAVRVVRIVELLEQIGTSEAVDVLRQLEKKTGDAAVREEVRRSLGRLSTKQKAP